MILKNYEVIQESMMTYLGSKAYIRSGLCADYDANRIGSTTNV